MLENLSIQGAFFLLENDPDPEGFMEVGFQGAQDSKSGFLAGNRSTTIKSQLIRKYPVELPDKVKNGIAVVFR